MADLESFLAANNLSHVLQLLQAGGESTLSSLESKLEAGRAGFLTHLKTIGLTALKDRQGLTNALAKLKRERESGGGAAAGGPDAPAPKFNPKNLKKYVGPNDDCDLFGRKRGAHKRAGLCACFMRAQGKNENDIEAFNCYSCGEPPNDHADLGPAPHVEEDEPEEFDISKFAVQGAGFDTFRKPGEKKEPEPTELTAEHEQMYSAGTDPLALATMAVDQKQGGGAGGGGDPSSAADPLAAMMGGATIDVSDVGAADPLGLAGMERSAPAAGSSGASGGASGGGSGGGMSFEEIMRLGSGSSAAAGGGSAGGSAGGGGCTAWAVKAGVPEAAAACLASIAPAELSRLYETGGRPAVDARLKAVGLTSMGHRLKLVSVMQGGDMPSGTASPAAAAPASPATPASPAVDADDPLAAAAARGVDVPEMRRKGAAGDRAGVSAALKAAGLKMGERLKVEAALFPADAAASPKPATTTPQPGTFEPYQMDLFGNKRGRCLKCLRTGFDEGVQTCMKYEAKVVAMNHCAGPGDPSVLNCITCGCGPAEHADLGMWQNGEPMAVTLEGRRIKTLQVG
jgi:hypothetical protein